MSMSSNRNLSRRSFLHGTIGTAAGAWALSRYSPAARAQTTTAPATANAAELPPTQVALTAGDSRADNVFRALKMVEQQVREGIARKKQVLIKPNVVVVNRQLTATHADCLEGILEFLKPIVKGEILLGDSPAGGQITEGYSNYKYYQLRDRYPNVRFINLDELPNEVRYVTNQRYQPQAMRFAKLLLDPQTYVISAAVPKTHDRAICTLSLKNVVVGAAIKDKGSGWTARTKGPSNDKLFIHGGPNNEAIHLNLFNMAQHIRPDLAVIDGYQGMEGNGPIVGTPVDQRIAVASADFLAADRVAVELMGFDFAQVGYLSFCAKARLGQADLSRIELLGEKIADHKRKYRPHDTFQKQLEWMTRGT